MTAEFGKDSPSQTWLTFDALTATAAMVTVIVWVMSSMIFVWNYRSYEREWSSSDYCGTAGNNQSYAEQTNTREYIPLFSLQP